MGLQRVGRDLATEHPALDLLIIQAVGAERGPNNIQVDTILTVAP